MADVPAPGTYNPSDIDSAHNSYILSTNKNGGTKKFMLPTNATLKQGLNSETS
jgi:hypothetical protein